MVGMGFAVLAGLGAAGKLASGLMSAGARRSEFDEMIRGLKMKRDYTVGLATARAAASGIEMESGSTVQYLSKLTSEFGRQVANMKKARDVTYKSDIFSALTGGVGDAASIYGGLGQANNWWQREG